MRRVNPSESSCELQRCYQVFMSELLHPELQQRLQIFFFFFLSIPLNGAERGATLVHSKYTKGRAKKKEKRRRIREGLRVLSKFMTTR